MPNDRPTFGDELRSLASGPHSPLSLVGLVLVLSALLGVVVALSAGEAPAPWIAAQGAIGVAFLLCHSMAGAAEH